MEWQTALHENVQQSQQALRKLLAGRLVFTPDRDGGWSFTAEGRLEAVVAGRLPGLPTSVVSPTGHTDSALLVRAYRLVQAYADLRFTALGKWRVKSAG